jgi:hypothetical protein
MKTKRMIAIALVMASVASVSYWLGYENGSNRAGRRLNPVGAVKMIGLGFQQYHNDVARFTATGGVVNGRTLSEEQ